MSAGSDAAAPKPAKRRADLRVLSRVVAMLRPHAISVVCAAVALAVASGAVLALGIGLRWLVDTGFAAGLPERLDQALIGLFIVVGVLAAATFARAQLVVRIGERVAAELRRRAFDNVLSLSPSYLETRRVGDVVSRLGSDITVLQTIVGTSVSWALRNALIVIGGVALMAMTSAKLTILALALVLVVVVPAVILGRRVRRLSRAAQERLGAVSAEVDEALPALPTIQAFGVEANRSIAFGRALDAAVATSDARNSARAILVATIILIVFSAVGIVLWIGGHDALAGRISTGQLSAFVFFAVMVASSVGSLSEFGSDLQQAAGAAERVFELIDAEPAIATPADPTSLPTPARGRLSLDAVSFRYPREASRMALDGVNLVVEPGETVALVGPSGAGKSTVLALALRFFDPTHGRVAFDGVDIAAVDPRALRARIGFVPQEPAMFAASVAENIRLGRLDADDDAVRAAARAAQADGFIARLPQGYATLIGERGQGLSVGQRQRIAIARAILRDPALLLLDEATSALDAESEMLVQQALERLRGTRATLVVAHRLATVQRADRIVVLDRGRIVEQGTHAQLLRAGQLYTRLAELQFLMPDTAAQVDAAVSGS